MNWVHRNRGIHIERECLAVLWNKQKYFYFFTSQIFGAVAADLLYKSLPGLCLIISRAARYLPKSALNNIPSLSVHTIISMIEELLSNYLKSCQISAKVGPKQRSLSLSVYTIISMIEELYALFFAESRYIIKLRIFSFCARVKQTNRLKLFLAQDAWYFKRNGLSCST